MSFLKYKSFGNKDRKEDGVPVHLFTERYFEKELKIWKQAEEFSKFIMNYFII